MPDNHDSNNRAAWLTPGLFIQIITIIVSMTIGWATMNNKVQGLQERIAEIRAALPNNEALNYRLKVMDDRISRNESEYLAIDAWVRNTRERLAEKGWRP